MGVLVDVGTKLDWDHMIVYYCGYDDIVWISLNINY